MKSFSSTKVAIIGAGAVGSTVAYATAIRNVVSEVSLIDIAERKEEGEVMDIADGMSFVKTGAVKGADFKDAKKADIIVITAGAPQKKGETRLDLVNKNVGILSSVLKSIGKIKSTAIIIVVANPVDVLTFAAQKLSGLPPSQVFGSGTTLDTARLHNHLGTTLGVSAHDVSGFVLGEHGDSEFVAWSSVSIAGASAKQMKKLSALTKKRIEKKVRHEAYEIINRKGATHFGIGLVVADIIEAIIYDQQRVLPVSGRVTNWNGVSGVCLGAPAVIGRSGILRHWPLSLTSQEKKYLKSSAKILKGYNRHV